MKDGAKLRIITYCVIKREKQFKLRVGEREREREREREKIYSARYINE